MFLSGFTFIRNAIKFDYPAAEAIASILPLCDEFVVAVGNSEDGTRELIGSIGSPKIRIIDTVWDDTLREGGRVLAVETDKAFRAIDPRSTWAFYIQADEVVHEQYHPAILEACRRWKDDKAVDGLLFNYLHFYGSYDFVGDSPRWYRREVRIVRNAPGITSYRDAQGFRKNGEKLRVKPADAWMYHYGWVKPPESMQAKQEDFNKYWHDDAWMERNIPKQESFDYSGIDSLKHFTGTHPLVMQERIARKNWHFDFDPTRKNFSFKSKIRHFIEQNTGWRIGEYRNYRD